jgi:hypothetical protein
VKKSRPHSPPDEHAPKSFIVDMDASLFKKFPQLSRTAQHLYVNMRFLADGKSGELRHKDGTWMKATHIQKKSSLCRNVRLRSMRELIQVGLVLLERPRKMQMIAGRLRAVSGGCQYTVCKAARAKSDRKPNDSSKVPLQKSRSSTVEEKDPQVFPITPTGASTSGLGLDGRNSFLEEPSSSSKHLPQTHNQTTDDDPRASDLLPENYSPKPKVNGQPAAKKRPKQKKLAPALHSWIRCQILKRAGDVSDPHSYVRASLDEFVANLAVEVEEHLTQVAQEFCLERDRKNPGATVVWNDIFAALSQEARKHQLPISDPEMFARVTRAAMELLGWKVTE